MPELVVVSEGQRDRIWELHLRGVNKTEIARRERLAPGTVRNAIRQCYLEQGADIKEARARKLTAAVARLRHIQEQAWIDHDEDDQREREVLSIMREGVTVGVVGEKSAAREQVGRASVRYQSQRAAYLRVVLDAEREIARLEGLYEATGVEEGAVVFRIEAHGSTVTAGLYTRKAVAVGNSTGASGSSAAVVSDVDEGEADDT